MARGVIQFFVDDGVFATTILAWIASIAWFTHRSVVTNVWNAPLLAIGIMAALLVSLVHGCYKVRTSSSS